MARDITYDDLKQIIDKLPSDPSWSVGALELRSMGVISIAGRLADAAQQLYHTLHTPKTLLPGNLTDAQYAQRCAILELAHKIIESERDRAMDEACVFWLQYRKRS